MGSFPYTFPFFFHVYDYYKRRYTIEVRETDGSLVRKLPETWGITLRTEINTPALLQFSCPLYSQESDALNPGAEITGGREVWLIGPNGQLSGMFRVIRRIPNDSGGVPTLTVEARDLLSQWLNESLFEYDVTDRTIADILADLVAEQTQDNPLSVGIIDTTIAAETRTIKIEQDQTFLQTLVNIHSGLSYDSQFWVDDERKLNWRRIDSQTQTADERKDHSLRIGRNLNGIDYDIDDEAVVTRLYIYGGNDLGKRITLKDAGETNDYLEDFSYSSKIQSRRIIRKDIKDAAELLRVGQRELSRLAQPPVSYDLTIADNSAVSTNEFEALTLGDRKRVIDENLDIDTVQNIVAIQYNIDSPAKVRVELSTLENRARTNGIIDDLIDLHESDYGNDPTDITEFRYEVEEGYENPDADPPETAGDLTRELDGASIRPGTLLRVELAKVTAVTSTSPPRYTCNILTNPGRVSTSENFTDCIQHTSSDSVFYEVDEEVLLFIPTEEERIAGELPIISGGGEGGGGVTSSFIVWEERVAG